MNKKFIMFIDDEEIIMDPHNVKIVKFDIPARVKIFHKDKEYNNCIFKNDLQFGYVIEYERNQ